MVENAEKNDTDRKRTGRNLPEGLIIRSARQNDAEGISLLGHMPKYFWGMVTLPFEAPENLRRRVEYLGKGSLFLVAERAGTVVGIAGLDRFEGRRGHAGQVFVGVRDDLQGQGIGRALMETVVDAADRWLGTTRLELTVFVDNVAAIRLYRSLGFEVEGTLRDYAFRDGVFVDALTMARMAPRICT